MLLRLDVPWILTIRDGAGSFFRGQSLCPDKGSLYGFPATGEKKHDCIAIKRLL